MTIIEWKQKGERPGPYDTVYGRVDGAEEPRFVLTHAGSAEPDDVADQWRAEDMDTSAQVTGRFTECVSWCWDRVNDGSGVPD